MAEINSEQLTFHGYELTNDISFQNESYGITPKLAKLLEKAAFGCQDRKDKRIVEKLKNLVETYPHIPMFKNYLSVAYNMLGMIPKSREINVRIIQEHPGYLFGKLNQANNFIERGEPEKVPGVLGESLELKDLYPERKIFQFSEYTNYLNVVIRYLAAIQNLELAENKLDLLKELDPDDFVTDQADSFLWLLRLKKAGERIEEEKKHRIAPLPVRLIPESDKSEPPVFNHAEIFNLYLYDLEIPQHLLKEILALPRKTLVEDLLTVLQDAVNRYDFFSETSFQEETTCPVVHVFFLLMELEAEECLPAILDFLEYENDFLDFWLGDHLNNTLWQCILHLGKDNLGLLKQFLITPGIYTYSKTMVSEALCRMAIHYPEKRAAILELHAEVFATFLASKVEDNLVDTDFLGIAISNAKDCGFTELLPIIRELFDKQYVAKGIMGDYNKVESEFSQFRKPIHSVLFQSIFELYDHVQETWEGYQEEEESDDGDDDDDHFYHPPQIAPAGSVKKTGRNDPCPCGSGKKYKKCCMDKEIQ